MACTHTNIRIVDKIAIPSFDLEWAGECFVLAINEAEIENPIAIAKANEDLIAMAECACKSNAARSMRFDEIEPCIQHTLAMSRQ